MNQNFVFVCFLFILILGMGIMAIYYIPQIISYLLEPKSGSMKSEKNESSKVSPSEKPNSEKVRVKTDSRTGNDSKKTSKEKESLFSKINILGGKKKCNECGTTLEYREEYQSYYCPKCRTYK